MAWWNRLANVVRSKRLSKDIDRELAFHIEERTDELVASGMDEAKARRLAVRQFGSPLRHRERTRDADVLLWLENLVADVRYAWRALRGNPGFALVAILSLALGIGANTAIFSVIDALLLESLPVHRPEELVRVTRNKGATRVTNPIWEEVRDRQDFFAGVFAYTGGDRQFNLARGGEVRLVPGSWVSGDYFVTLGLEPALGRLLTRDDDTPGCTAVAVLSHSFWRSEYGEDPGVIGRSISLDRHDHTIVGVAPPGFTGLALGQPTHVFVPLCSREIHQEGVLALRSAWNLYIMGRPADGMGLEQLRARLARIAPAVFAATIPTDWGVELQREYLAYTLSAEPAPRGEELLRDHYTKPLMALMVAVGIVLLIACVNVANLLLARAEVRRRELAIRLAIGVSRTRLLRQLLTESLLLASLGAVVGVLFAHWGSRFLVGLLSSGSVAVQLDLSLNLRMLGFTMLVAGLTGLLFGLAPAWGAMRLAPHSAMKATARGAEGRSRFHPGKALVAAQVALSLVLLVGAGLFMGTFQRLTSLDAGFDRHGILLVDVDLPSATVDREQRAAVYRDLLERFRALPGVRSASASQTTPIGGNIWNSWIAVDGYSPTSRDDALVYLNEVSDSYFATLGTALIQGRDFDARDVAESEQVALINRTMARKFFGGADPIGREFRIQFVGDELGPATRIIGVVEDARYESLREEPPPTAYLPLTQNTRPGSSYTFELRSRGAAEMLIEGVKAAAEQHHPSISLEFQTLQAQMASSLALERILALLSSFFGVLALLLCVIGLYGTLSYSVARRRKEIGVRLALGAAPARVLRMVLGEAGAIVLGGLALGLISAFAGTRLISSFLFDLSPTDPKTIAAAAVVLTIVALAASALPAWRAAATDAGIPLREE